MNLRLIYEVYEKVINYKYLANEFWDLGSYWQYYDPRLNWNINVRDSEYIHQFHKYKIYECVL